jgi:fumarylacetoacetase
MPDAYDPQLRSWVESANHPLTDFPIQNLPFGVFRHIEDSNPPAIGVAIGDQVFDLRRCAKAGLLEVLPAATVQACIESSLNALMGLGRPYWVPLRRRISELLRTPRPGSQNTQQLVRPMLLPISECVMMLPANIGDYTDFYASMNHAKNVGALFRPDSPLMPNYRHIPIGYHGRASSIVVSGTPVRRPSGQTREIEAASPSFGPSRALDYELEVGFFVGHGNPQGEPIALPDAESHIFGLCLMNDWSARDIQAWEYQPLGPFLSKNFGTTISPWIVMMDALEPFRVPAVERGDQDPALLPYLISAENNSRGGIDLKLEVYIRSQRMRQAGIEPMCVGRVNFRDMYWTAAQLVTHHTSTGCNLRPGDLIASGTVSGTTRDSLGCMLELTRRGAEPIDLPTGEKRRFLEDGDEITLRGFCERAGFPRIGFGDCCGTIIARGNG